MRLQQAGSCFILRHIGKRLIKIGADMNPPPGTAEYRAGNVIGRGAELVHRLAAARASEPEAGGSPSEPGMGAARPMSPPLVMALDRNGDGSIDADEIAGAGESLKKLDRNGDGKLTTDEYRPPFPGGQGGPDGPGGGGPGGGGEGRPNRQRPPSE